LSRFSDAGASSQPNPVQTLAPSTLHLTGAVWIAPGLIAAALIAHYGLDRELYVLAGLLVGYGLALLISTRLRPESMVATLVGDIHHMPTTMRQLAPVQFFSWFALFAMWIYTTAAVTSVHYGSTDTESAAFNEGANWVGVLFAAYNGFAALAAIVIPWMVRRVGLRISHLINLALGGAGLISIVFIRDPDWLLLSMLGVGFAWASILSWPYALLSDSVPAHKMGVYMGIFNFFIVISQLVAASLLGYVLRQFFDLQSIFGLVIGGALMIIAGFATLLVDKEAEPHR
jgi:maltose/moltooligosaccharide transporter